MSTPITSEELDLEKLEELEKAATPGMWSDMPCHWGKAGIAAACIESDPLRVGSCSGVGPFRRVAPDQLEFDDAKFIAALRNVAPALIQAARELATLKAELTETTTSLECSHCGGDAITSPTGLFGDGDGGKCNECGMPGRVSADGEGAYWLTSDDPDDRCERGDCSGCPPKREPFEGIDHPSTATAATLAEANGLPTSNPDDFDLRDWNPGKWDLGGV